jgi:hypothetical protein
LRSGRRFGTIAPVWRRRRADAYDLTADIRLILITLMELDEKLQRVLSRLNDDDEEE